MPFNTHIFSIYLVQDMVLTFQSIVNLLSCLKSKQSLQESQPSKVRFHDPSDGEDQPTNTKVKTKKRITVSDVDVTLLYGGKLLATVSKTVGSCLERVWLENSETDLVLVTELIKDFFSSSLLNAILAKLESLPAKDLPTSHTSRDVTRCINELVLPLLDNGRQEIHEKWLSCAAQLLFVFLAEVEETEQQIVLERVFQVSEKVD
jgi:hypothetical protein